MFAHFKNCAEKVPLFFYKFILNVRNVSSNEHNYLNILMAQCLPWLINNKVFWARYFSPVTTQLIFLCYILLQPPTNVQIFLVVSYINNCIGGL